MPRVKDRMSRALGTLRQLATPAAALSADERARLSEQRVEGNRARTAAVMPAVVAIQVVTLLLFHLRPSGEYIAFRAGVFKIHGSALPVAVLLSVLAFVAGRRKLHLAWFGDVVLLFAIALGLALSLNTHHLSPNLNAFTTALFASTLVVRPTLAGALLGYGVGLVGLVVGLGAVQTNPEVRLATSTAGSAAVLISFAFSRVLDMSLVRDVVQRMTIERQKSELVAWNAELEKRVEAQVRETLEHAEKARALDAQLRWKVRDRSRELARALRTSAQDGAAIRPGSRFEGRFDIDRTLGSGAMGDVLAAHDHASGQEVAIKVLRRSEDLDPQDVERFISEAAAAATVVHPAVVRTYHVDITDSGCFYLVMELVRGRTLADELTRGRFDAAQTARLGAVVAEALAAAHATGVLHRDIKPGNLMVTSAPPGVRVLDFGVSKLLDAETGELSRAGQVVGTPQYMAPEQIIRKGKLTGACDVYALGQVLYEMLVGEPCFTGKTVREVLQAQVSDAPISLRSRAGPEIVPDDLAGLIARCLEKPPEARPSAHTLAAALRVIADAMGAPPLEAIGTPRYPWTTAREHDFGAATVRAPSDSPSGA